MNLQWLSPSSCLILSMFVAQLCGTLRDAADRCIVEWGCGAQRPLCLRLWSCAGRLHPPQVYPHVSVSSTAHILHTLNMSTSRAQHVVSNSGYPQTGARARQSGRCGSGNCACINQLASLNVLCAYHACMELCRQGVGWGTGAFGVCPFMLSLLPVCRVCV